MQSFPADIIKNIGFKSDWMSILCYRITCRRFHPLFNAHFWKEKTQADYGLRHKQIYACNFCHYLAIRRDNIRFHNDPRIRAELKEISKILVAYLRHFDPNRYKIYYMESPTTWLYHIAFTARKRGAGPGNLIIDKSHGIIDRIGYCISANRVAFKGMRDSNEFPQYFIDEMEKLGLTLDEYLALYEFPTDICRNLRKFVFVPSQMGTISDIMPVNVSDIIIDLDFGNHPVSGTQDDVPALIEDT